MKRSHGFLMIAALFIAGLCGAVYSSVRIGADVPATDPTSAKQLASGAWSPESEALAEMRRELAQLRLQVRSQMQQPAMSDPGKKPAQELAAARDPRSDPEAREEAARARREYMAGVEVAFRKETTDPAWSSAASAVVQKAIASDNDLRPLTRSVECRSHTCRVEIAGDGSDKLGDVLPMFIHQVGQELPRVTGHRVKNADGTATTVLYMSRPGETPDPPQGRTRTARRTDDG